MRFSKWLPALVFLAWSTAAMPVSNGLSVSVTAFAACDWDGNGQYGRTHFVAEASLNLDDIGGQATADGYLQLGSNTVDPDADVASWPFDSVAHLEREVNVYLNVEDMVSASAHATAKSVTNGVRDKYTPTYYDVCEDDPFLVEWPDPVYVCIDPNASECEGTGP